MFEYLKGKVEYKKPDYLALDVNGVGYKVIYPLEFMIRLKLERVLDFTYLTI